jgi:PAS domain S-box-containing protein
LRETARQFRTLIGGVTDYALFMLDPNGLVINWNTGAGRIKGYTADEIIGQRFSRFYTDRDRAAGLPARALQTAA